MLVTVAVLVSLVGCAGYIPGRQAYWDRKVSEMCAKDGGTTVYEVVMLSREDYARLGDLVEFIPPESARPRSTDKPYVVELLREIIRDENPAVVRGVTSIRRQSDNKVLGKMVQYSRRGGDFPTGISEQSMFVCPQRVNLASEVFRVGDEK